MSGLAILICALNIRVRIIYEYLFIICILIVAQFLQLILFVSIHETQVTTT